MSRGRPTKHEVRYRNTGRKKVVSKRIVAKLEEGFMMGFTDMEACLWAGISRSSLNRYIKLNPSFGTKREKLKHNPTMRAKALVIGDVIKGKKDDGKWLLENSPKSTLNKKMGDINVNLNGGEGSQYNFNVSVEGIETDKK